MKKVLIIIVASLFLITLTGCSSKDSEEEQNKKELTLEQKELEKAKSEVIAEVGVDKVYWAKSSKKYHVDPDCPAFSYSETVYEGTVEDAFERGLDPCRRCIPELDEE